MYVRFGDDTDHLVMNELGGDLVLEPIYDLQAKLNLLNQNIFPLLPQQRRSSTTVSICSVTRNYNSGCSKTKRNVFFGSCMLSALTSYHFES